MHMISRSLHDLQLCVEAFGRRACGTFVWQTCRARLSALAILETPGIPFSIQLVMYFLPVTPPSPTRIHRVLLLVPRWHEAARSGACHILRKRVPELAAVARNGDMKGCFCEARRL